MPRGSQVEVIDIGNGDYSFKMPQAPVIVNATFINVTPTAVSLPAADHNQRPTRFNMMGQPVGEGYKGIVIENGTKKFAR